MDPAIKIPSITFYQTTKKVSIWLPQMQLTDKKEYNTAWKVATDVADLKWGEGYRNNGKELPDIVFTSDLHLTTPTDHINQLDV